MSTEEIYASINSIIAKSKECGHDDLARRLDDALHLGSSGLEILGAIRNVLKDEHNKVYKLIGKGQVHEIINFIDIRNS